MDMMNHLFNLGLVCLIGYCMQFVILTCSKQDQEKRIAVQLKPIKFNWLHCICASWVIQTVFAGNPLEYIAGIHIVYVSVITDIKYRIIPNECSVGLLLFGIMIHTIQSTPMTSIIGATATMACIAIFMIITWLITKQDALGGGDIKLFIGIGALWGWKIGLMTIYISLLAGGITGLWYIVVKKRSKTDTMCFAPFIMIGLIPAILYAETVLIYYYPWVFNSFKLVI